MTVFAIDPGPHTAIFYRNSRNEFSPVTLDFTVFSNEPLRNLMQWLECHIPKGATVILEPFEFRKDDARYREYIDYSTGEYVGVVKLFCQIYGHELVMQGASVAKGFWTDDKLKRVGLYKLCKNRHERDACRHWLHYVTFTLDNREWLYKLR